MLPGQPKDISDELMKANALIEQDDLRGALQMLNDLVLSGNNQPFLHLALGDVYKELNLNDEAIKCYNLAITQEAEEYIDKRVRTAANAGLAGIYIDASWKEFDNLPRVEKIDEIREKIPEIIQKKAFRSIALLGGWGSCTVAGTGLPGYWVRTSQGKTCVPCE